ncbi:hypothetical protein Tco_1115747, partial [Tanacetum coccineum]
MNNYDTIAYSFELNFTTTSLDGLKPRNINELQVLADFLAEMPSIEVKDKETEKCEIQNEESKSKDTWQLYTDGASSSDGSGTSLMLVSPEGKELMCR